MKNNIWELRGEALCDWLDAVKTISNSIGTKVEDMYVASYIIYTDMEPMTIYKLNKVERVLSTSLNENKSLKALESVEHTKEQEEKLNSLLNGDTLPIKVFLGKRVIDTSTKSIYNIHKIALDEKITITVGYLKAHKSRMYSDKTVVDSVEYVSTKPIVCLGEKLLLSDIKGNSIYRSVKWLSITESGYIRPIEFIEDEVSFVLDNKYLYIKVSNNGPRVIGSWTDNYTIEIYSALNKKKYRQFFKKLNSIISLIGETRNYIVPEGLLSPHRIFLD